MKTGWARVLDAEVVGQRELDLAEVTLWRASASTRNWAKGVRCCVNASSVIPPCRRRSGASVKFWV